MSDFFDTLKKLNKVIYFPYFPSSSVFRKNVSLHRFQYFLPDSSRFEIQFYINCINDEPVCMPLWRTWPIIPNTSKIVLSLDAPPSSLSIFGTPSDRPVLLAGRLNSTQCAKIPLASGSSSINVSVLQHQAPFPMIIEGKHLHHHMYILTGSNLPV